MGGNTPIPENHNEPVAETQKFYKPLFQTVQKVVQAVHTTVEHPQRPLAHTYKAVAELEQFEEMFS